MKYLPLNPNSQHRKDGEHSFFSRECPICHAPAWHYCTSLHGGNGRFGGYHRARADKPINHEPLPDMRDKWKEWAQYEGIKPKPRPKDLQV